MTKMPENNKERNQRFKTMFKYGAFAGIGCITAPFVASFGLSLMGFKSAGIAAGSLAATLQVSSFTKLFLKKCALSTIIFLDKKSSTGFL